MASRRAGSLSLAIATAAVVSNMAAAAQQPSTGVDFQRDVQPILRDHCVSCHGPEMQMNGLRLDRRADALRGGTQSDIGPGNADGSRLYHRLIGTSIGPQMPPGAPLGDEQIEIIKQWIDEGAAWPDEASGETPSPPADPDATSLIALIRTGDRRAIDALLRRNPRAAILRGPAGTTPLMAAAVYGDAGLVKQLLAAGADPNVADAAGATSLMWATPDVAKMQLLLDAGADTNARSEDLRTALEVTSGIVGAAPALRLLLEYGADATAVNRIDVTPLRESVRVDDVEMFRLLREYGAGPRVASPYVRTNCRTCAALVDAGDPLPRTPPPPGAGATAPIYDPGRLARPTPIGETPATPESIRAAVERSLPLLQDVDAAFVRQTGCASCHHNSLVAMAVSTARANGYAVDETIARTQLTTIGAYLESWRERTLQNLPIAGGVDTISYLLFGLASEHYTPDPATDAQALWLKRRQAADGRWPFGTLRPPIESNDVAETALSIRALQAFAPPAQRAEYQKSIDRARAWLTTAETETTEERAFRVLGLSWAKAPAADVGRAARDLLAAQRPDGGWAQTDAMGSDAYATGEALVALREGLGPSKLGPYGNIDSPDLTSRAYRKGLEFLLRTQIDDGSWFVETRAVPIQAYFESGFPYGVNQWISAAATAWATTALALAR
ncbi:MAG: ankyrin repeat domain-containing protein [Acidobacteria bacterium]|nr:ankyrin repeat domain-containing protein [Acidobacteriota bacterium]